MGPVSSCMALARTNGVVLPPPPGADISSHHTITHVLPTPHTTDALHLHHHHHHTCTARAALTASRAGARDDGSPSCAPEPSPSPPPI
jgi:hypothetical protein